MRAQLIGTAVLGGASFTKRRLNEALAAAPLGWVIKVTNGTRITRHYVDPREPRSDDLHLFESPAACRAFVRTRKAACQAEGRPSVFDIYRYRFEPVFPGRGAR